MRTLQITGNIAVFIFKNHISQPKRQPMSRRGRLKILGFAKNLDLVPEVPRRLPLTVVPVVKHIFAKAYQENLIIL